MPRLPTAADPRLLQSRKRFLLLALVPLLWLPVPSASPDLERLAAHIDSLLADDQTAGIESLAVAGLNSAQDAFGAQDERTIPWLVRIGDVYCRLGRHTEAQALLLRAEELALQRGSCGRTALLDVLRMLHKVYIYGGDRSALASNAQRCLELAQELYGRGDPRTATHIWKLAQVEMRAERYAVAEEYLAEARALLEHEEGPECRHLTGILCDHARIAANRGEGERAMDLYDRALSETLRQYGPDHPKMVNPLLGQARLLRRRGEFAEAEATIRRCLTMREAASGPHHPQMATILNNLGVVLANRGKYHEAVAAYRRSLDITVANYGERHSEAANTMVNLANSLAAEGLAGEAIYLRRRAVAIAEELYGEENTLTAFALAGLARAARAQGDHRAAEEFFRRCLAITEHIYTHPHPETALYRRELGRALLDQGRIREAREYLERAVAEAAEVHGADDYQVARNERYLGIALLAQGEITAGRQILEKCHHILEARYGEYHPALLTTLYYLALAALWEQEDESARDLATRCLAITEHASDATHRTLVRALRLGLLIDIETGHPDEAIEKGLRACEMALAIQDDIFQVSSEQEAIAFARLPQRTAERLLGAIQRVPLPDDAILSRTFALVARTQGQVLDRLAQRWRALERAADSSQVGTLHRRHLAASSRLANLILRGAQRRTSSYDAEIEAARNEKRAAERALAAVSELHREELENQRWQAEVTAAELDGALPPGAVLIHFVRFPQLTRRPAAQFAQRASNEPHLWIRENTRYGAFRLQADGKADYDLRFFDLGDATALDSLVMRYRNVIERIDAGRMPSVRDEADYRIIARRLYDHLWSPLIDERGASMVFVIPAAKLNLIDFHTLLGPNEDLVIEHSPVHLLSSARDLLRAGRERDDSGGGHFLIVGNPILSAHPEIAHATAPLPGAEEEARALARLYESHAKDSSWLLTGASAREGIVTEFLPQCRVAHFATHGFFWEVGTAAEENPLLCSGLLLGPGPHAEDGILTAQELTGYDLRGVEWVVLSACRSGLGQLLPGEGVAGLRRALEIAGVHSVVMALWPLRDYAAADLMTRICRKRLAGASTIAAVRSAQLERLEEVRTRRGRIHPVLWGGIVSEGDWR